MIDEDHPFLKDAYEFARDRYLLKKMDNSNELYFNHVLTVYFHVYSFIKDIDVRVASILYELLNINRGNKDEIARHFNNEIADYVSELKDKQVLLKESGEVDYYIRKMNRLSPQALMIQLADRLNRIKSLDKLKKEFLKSNPDFPENYCAHTVEIISGINHDRLNTEHELMIDQIHQAIDSYYKIKQRGDDDENSPLL